MTLLVGDIGGTNARFALGDPGAAGFSRAMNLLCADYPGPVEAIRHYLAEVGAGDPERVCIAVAGPISDGEARLTNNHWRLQARALSEQLSGASVHLINDFAAIALALPHLAPADCIAVGPASPLPLDGRPFTVGLLGPGTGLGAAGLIGRGGAPVAQASEAGHVGFAPENAQQVDLLVALRERFPRVSVERLLSGPGLENIHEAMCRLADTPHVPRTAAEIFELASRDTPSIARDSVDLFFEILGQFAGDLALALGAEDGIYIAGGMVRRFPERLEQSRFRQAFEEKGRHRALMERIPTTLVVHDNPGLLGASSQLHLGNRPDAWPGGGRRHEGNPRMQGQSR